MAEREELLQHHGHLHAVGRGERVELHRVRADRELLVVRGAGSRPVDVGETPSARAIPLPDLGRRIGLRSFRHPQIPPRSPEEWPSPRSVANPAHAGKSYAINARSAYRLPGNRLAILEQAAR